MKVNKNKNVFLKIFTVVSGYNKANQIQRKPLTGIVHVYDIVGKSPEVAKSIFALEQQFLTMVKVGVGLVKIEKTLSKSEFKKIKKTAFNNFIIVKHKKPYVK